MTKKPTIVEDIKPSINLVVTQNDIIEMMIEENLSAKQEVLNSINAEIAEINNRITERIKAYECDVVALIKTSTEYKNFINIFSVEEKVSTHDSISIVDSAVELYTPKYVDFEPTMTPTQFKKATYEKKIINEYLEQCVRLKLTLYNTSKDFNFITEIELYDKKLFDKSVTDILILRDKKKALMIKLYEAQQEYVIFNNSTKTYKTKFIKELLKKSNQGLELLGMLDNISQVPLLGK